MTVIEHVANQVVQLAQLIKAGDPNGPWTMKDALEAAALVATVPGVISIVPPEEE